jgi:hypothetical protein
MLERAVALDSFHAKIPQKKELKYRIVPIFFQTLILLEYIHHGTKKPEGASS